jgi:hypothetical protein
MDAFTPARPMRSQHSDDFSLTQAIRPSPPADVTPRQAYRIQAYKHRGREGRLSVLTAAVSRERLFEVFLELLDPLGAVVDVILESSHERLDGRHTELEREGIDLPVLLSHLCEFEDLLLNDGCTGIAVLNEAEQMEVHFDEHKLLYVYAPRLRAFERVLMELGVPREDDLRILTEAEHVHCTHPRFRDEFEQLCNRAGVMEAAEEPGW